MSQSWEAWHGIEGGAAAAARQYFEETGVIISPTAVGQTYAIPGTAETIPADKARELSLQTRKAIGGTAL